MRLAAGVLLGSLFLLSTAGQAEATIIGLDPTLTFYHTDSVDTGGDAIPVDLGSLGIVGGDFVRLRILGDFCYYFFPSCTEQFFGAGAVFVNNTTLLDRNQANRVVGAIDAGVDIVTPLTYFENEPTDIPEDFFVGSVDVVIQVPIGATHLFVAPSDSYFGDNADVDGDFALSIGKVPEPSSLGLLGLGLSLASLVAHKSRKRG